VKDDLDQNPVHEFHGLKADPIQVDVEKARFVEVFGLGGTAETKHGFRGTWQAFNVDSRFARVLPTEKGTLGARIEDEVQDLRDLFGGTSQAGNELDAFLGEYEPRSQIVIPRECLQQPQIFKLCDELNRHGFGIV
jgi:hypothetical protein